MEIRAGVNLGRYQLLAELGRGAMGTVYQALDPEIDRIVAIKTFSAFDSISEEGVAFRNRFAQEARAAGRLAHPGIVAIYDRGEESTTGAPFIVMEYIPGQPLNKVLAQSGGRLEQSYALTVAKEIAEALAYAHEKGVVHRDIKPANILITEDGNAKIADFGVARIDMSTMTFHGQLLGTPAYMSPEQLTGGAVDGRSDIFSLGVILYTMLMGFRPFQGNGASTIGFKVINKQPLPITTFHLDLSKDAEYVVARAMAKNPQDRYQTGTAFALDVQDILDGREPRSRREAGALPNSEVLRVVETTPKTNGFPAPNANGIGGFGANTTRVSKPPTAFTAQRVSSNASLTLLGLAFLAISGIAGVVAFYVNDTQRSALHEADAALPLPPLIVEQIPVPAITGAEFEPIIQVNFPEPSRVDGPMGSAKAPVSDLDRTVIHSAVVAPSAPVAAAPKPTTATWNDPLGSRQPATVELALQHHFAEAELQVWVDGKLEFTTTTRGENKKHLFGLKNGVEGRESHELRFPSGEHEVKVRVASKADQYDETGSIHSTFLDTRRSVLDIRCNKRGIELKLNSGS